jgi:hypothetical protein
VLTRLRLVALLLAFNCCYLEWGGGNSAFVFQAQYTFFTGSLAGIVGSITHPVILVGLVGQLALVCGVVWTGHLRTVVFASVIAMMALALFLLFVGAVAKNPRTIVSVVPFLVLAVWHVRAHTRAPRPRPDPLKSEASETIPPRSP